MHDDSKTVHYEDHEMDLHFLDIYKVLELIDAEEIDDITDYGYLVRIKSGRYKNQKIPLIGIILKNTIQKIYFLSKVILYLREKF